MDTEALSDTNVLPIELEKASLKLEKRNERAFDNAGFGATTGGLAITAQHLDKLITAVVAKLASPSASTSEHYKLERVIRQLQPEVIALATLQGALHSVALQDTLRDTYILIGKMICDECWAAKLTHTDKRLAGKINRAVKASHGSVDVRRSAARAMAYKAGFMMKHWTLVQMVHAGNWCLSLLLDTLPEVFELVAGRNREDALTITAGALHIAENAVAQAVIKNPVYQPRVTPCIPWTSFSQEVSERVTVGTSVLRTFHKDIIASGRHAIKTGQMQPALDGINALQSVPYVINTWIMNVIQKAYEAGISVAGMPMRDDMKLPPRLSEDQYRAMTTGETVVRSKEIAAIRKVNRSLIGERLLFKEDMETAQRLAPHEHFYVPMNMDWRGRVYGITYFNFAREDRVRALFLFANGEPIGTEGIYWLKMHVANCGDFNKIGKRPIEERIKWVDDNIDLIRDYVKRPLYATGWTQADCPFLFLASCRELVSAVDAGPTYVTRLPVSFDGSCSGIQHLAAMTRAPEGRYVNLTDTPEPQDVYQLVADQVKSRIEADEENPVLRKQCLDYGINRSVVKRNVMTFAYSSKVFGMGQQHLEDLMEPLKLKVLKKELEVHPFGDDEGYAAARYLAKHTHAAIVELVRLPAQAMAFLQACARALAHEGKPLRWTTPAGIPWINRYHDATVQRVELWLNDHGVKTRTRITVATGSETEISKDKVAAGVSPNFVHANDAAHLLLTVGAARDEGITDIATVHDSFGCHASHAGRFNQIIREQFLKMYTDHDVLAELLASAKADLTPANHHRLPELPEKGALDLKEILNAKYAFA